MDVSRAIALVTGANRGIGRCIVDRLLAAEAPRIYAGAREPAKLGELADDPRIVPLALDVTRPEQVARAAERCGDVTLLINNAGVNRNRPLIGEPQALANARAEIEVNYLGTLSMCRAFAPLLKANGGGTIVNILSAIGRVNLPAIGSYAASKAAEYSMTQGVRAELAGQGTRVVGVLPGAVDTEMTPGGDARPEDVAAAVVEAIAGGVEDLYPDAMARGIAEGLATDAKAVERELAAFLPD
ncbi:MAG: SDR family oxidoreductase [Defluviicoccus sp.]|nr:SDR family oxidoreductase [Defluviicoccus sp.]MDE0383415.1 SDR family oxidoreductase [Defluviicoccus sp.]